jgi:Cu/Ag efflux protein CusF
MRIIIVVLLFAAVYTFGSCSRTNKGNEGPEAAVQTNTYVGVGTVTDLDPKVPMIEIDHEDIKGLMPAMQMPFHVKDKALLDGIKVGDRVEFTVESGVNGIRVTAIRKL